MINVSNPEYSFVFRKAHERNANLTFVKVQVHKLKLSSLDFKMGEFTLVGSFKQMWGF